MNEDMSNLANELSNILKEKNIDLNSIIGNLNSKDTSSSKSQTSPSPNKNSELELSTVLNNSSNSSNDSSSNSSRSNSNFDFSNIDIETILKLKKAFDSINSTDDSRSHLLLSLKPYLRNSRKEKIDKYIKILNFTKIIDLFGGDKK